jgi:hypothetical protein
MSRKPNLDQLNQVQELNRAFLGYLHTASNDDLRRLGFPERACAALRAARTPELDTHADFPRALFRLALEADPLAAVRDPLRSVRDTEYHDMCFSILWAARSTSRQSAYQARLLFGLEPRNIQRLRALPLTELQALARVPDIVECAFADRAWLWIKLLSETRPEERRHLALVALQPGLELEWPQRRAPQAVT